VSSDINLRLLYRAFEWLKRVEIFWLGERYVVLTLPAIPHYSPLASIGE
jgi:hypothetical protein